MAAIPPSLFQASESSNGVPGDSTPLTTGERQELWRLRRDLHRALEERNQALRRLQDNAQRSGRGRGSRVLEERLREIRRELDQRNRENAQLLEMARMQADQLATLEPLPSLYLGRVEEIAALAEGEERHQASESVPSVAVEALNDRFNRAIERLWRVLDRDHVLENQGLRQTLGELQSALADKGQEMANLHAEQGGMEGRLVEQEGLLSQLRADIAQRDERIKGLLQRLEDLETDNRRLAKTGLSLKSQVKDLRRVVDPDVFSFLTRVRTPQQVLAGRWPQLFHPLPLALGAALGLVAALAVPWLLEGQPLGPAIFRGMPASRHRSRMCRTAWARTLAMAQIWSRSQVVASRWARTATRPQPSKSRRGR
jgi:hypothetical protein